MLEENSPIEENGFTTEPMRRTTQLDFAVEALRNAILNGEVGLGERVNEVAFTTKWGISRTTFREALRQMEQAGLLVRIPFRGTFVRDFTEEEIKSLNDLRGALETYAVERIIEQDGCQQEKLEPLYQIVAQMRENNAEADVAWTNGLHIAFHRTLMELAGDKILLEVWNDLSQQFWVAMRVDQIAVFEQGEAASFADSHREVVDAIAGVDVAVFRRVIRQHVSHKSNPDKTERSPL